MLGTTSLNRKRKQNLATYAIGDIQGCFESFMRLLDHCAFDPGHDRLWLVGDLVNRGPRSLETLRFIRNLGPAAITVLGNHDLSLLMTAEGFGKRGKGDTFDEILAAPDRDELLEWLRHQPLCHVEKTYCMVHAGLLPQWTAEQARALAAEVETEGVMDFRVKGEVAKAPAGYIPWFQVPGRCSADSVLITGHWSALGLKVMTNLLALDSGCLWGGSLTSIRLEDRAIFQVDCSKNEIPAA